MMIALLLILLVPVSALAQESLLVAQTTPPRLEWSYQPAPPGCLANTPNAFVRTSSISAGPFSTVATLAITATTYTLPTTANNLYYRIETACGASNVIQYVATVPPTTGPTLEARVLAVETKNAAQDLAIASLASRIAALENPPSLPPAENLLATTVNADQIEITGLNCTSLRTSGSGLKRVVTCVH